MSSIQIKILDAQKFTSVSESSLVSVMISLTKEASRSVEIPAGAIVSQHARITSDLLTQSIELHPGEESIISFQAMWLTVGLHDLESIGIQIIPIGGTAYERSIDHLPSYPIQVVPTFVRYVQISIVRIYDYDDATKVEIVFDNLGNNALREFEIRLGPTSGIRAGSITRHKKFWKAGEKITCDLILTMPTIDVACSALIDETKVSFSRTLTIPQAKADTNELHKPYVFLEPRSLSTDQIVLATDPEHNEISIRNGVFAVYGNKSRYRLTIFPSDSNASIVRVYPAAGQVEVEAQSKIGRESSFILTIIENPTMTQVVRIDYDVQVAGTTKRGEIYLSIRPTAFKHLSFASIAGAALTLKGLTNVVPLLMQTPGGLDQLIENFFDILEQSWSNWFQILIIPILWCVIRLADRLYRPWSEG